MHLSAAHEIDYLHWRLNKQDGVISNGIRKQISIRMISSAAYLVFDFRHVYAFISGFYLTTYLYLFGMAGKKYKIWMIMPQK